MTTAGNKYLPTDPGYQFRLQQGLQAEEQSAAAKGSQLSGATLKALQRYGQGQAAQEFQAAFGRNQQLAGMGQQAGNNMSTITQNTANQQSGLSSNLGSNLASVSSNLGGNLSNLYSHYGDLMSGNAINLGNTLGNNQLQLGQILSGRELGNSDFYGNLVTNLGKDAATQFGNIGDAQAAQAIGQAQAINQGIGGVTNALTQGLSLYGGGYGQNPIGTQQQSSYGVIRPFQNYR